MYACIHACIPAYMHADVPGYMCKHIRGHMRSCDSAPKPASTSFNVLYVTVVFIAAYSVYFKPQNFVFQTSNITKEIKLQN